MLELCSLTMFFVKLSQRDAKIFAFRTHTLGLSKGQRSATQSFFCKASHTREEMVTTQKEEQWSRDARIL